jgi:hypothetical protein
MDKIIIKYLKQGYSQEEISNLLKSQKVKPNSLSYIEKTINKIKKEHDAEPMFNLAWILSKKDTVMKLISMTDFVLKEKSTPKNEASEPTWFWNNMDSLTRIEKYAEFLKKPLELGMFVPCDENGNVLEFIEYECWSKSDKEYNSYMKKHHEAKDLVLFKGFKLEEKYLFHKEDLFMVTEDYNQTLSDIGNIEQLLTGYYQEIELTESAIKKLQL